MRDNALRSSVTSAVCQDVRMSVERRVSLCHMEHNTQNPDRHDELVSWAKPTHLASRDGRSNA
jgi:hypothetical protein